MGEVVLPIDHGAKTLICNSDHVIYIDPSVGLLSMMESKLSELHILIDGCVATRALVIPSPSMPVSSIFSIYG